MNCHSPSQIENFLIELGFDVIQADKTVVKFWYNGNIISFWVKKQWFSGKGVEDGRGFNNLINQIQ